MVPDSGLEALGSDSDPGHSHSHKKSRYLNQKKKSETMKHRDTETGSGTTFPRLYFQDCISGTAVPRSRESGLHLQDRISEITGIGTSF